MVYVLSYSLRAEMDGGRSPACRSLKRLLPAPTLAIMVRLDRRPAGECRWLLRRPLYTYTSPQWPRGGAGKVKARLPAAAHRRHVLT